MTIDARDFGRLESKVDLLLELQRDARKEHEGLEDRVRDVESSQAHAAGRQSIISAAVSMVVAGAVAWTVKHFA